MARHGAMEFHWFSCNLVGVHVIHGHGLSWPRHWGVIAIRAIDMGLHGTHDDMPRTNVMELPLNYPMAITWDAPWHCRGIVMVFYSIVMESP